MTAIPTTSTDYFSMDIKEHKEQAEAREGLLRLKSGERRSFGPIIPPKDLEQIIRIIKIAEQATLDEDDKRINECDEALMNIRSIKVSRQEDFPKMTQAYLKIYRLNFPKTQAEIEKTTLHNIENDHEGFSYDLATGHISSSVLDQMQQRAEAVLSEGYFKETDFEELEKDLLSMAPDKRTFALASREFDPLFAFLIFLLKKPEPHPLTSEVFYPLIEHVIDSEDLHLEGNIKDLLQLAMHHPQLSVLLGKEKDQVNLRVKTEHSKSLPTYDIISTSRFLLAVHSEYFHTFVQSNMLKEIRKEGDSSVPEIDLSRSAFKGDVITLFIHWIQQSTGLSIPTKYKTPAQIEKLLTHIPGLILRNQQAFLYQIQAELGSGITDETLLDIFKLAKKYMLYILEELCRFYINDHPSQAFQLNPKGEKSYRLDVRQDIAAPESIKATLFLESEKVQDVYLRKIEVESRGCWGAFKRGVGALGRLGKRAWRIGGDAAMRSAAFSGIIIGALRRDHASWPSWEIGVVSATLGMVAYPCVKSIFLATARSCHRPRPPFVVTLPGTFALSTGMARVSEGAVKVHAACTNRCTQNLGARIPLLSLTIEPLPPLKAITHLNLSEARLNDARLQWITEKHPEIRKLTIKPSPYLTAAGYRSLGRLVNLTHLTFELLDPSSPGALNEVNFSEIFGDNIQRRLDVWLSDITIAHYPLTFMQTIPERNFELRIFLDHVPIPQWGVLFESRRGYAQSAPWPNTLQKLTLNAPRITHLVAGCSLTITYEDCEALARISPTLKSVNLLYGRSTNEGSLLSLVNHLQLEEFAIDDSNVIDDGIIQQMRERWTKLKHFELIDCPELTNNSLQQLAQIPSLESCKLVRCNFTDAGLRFLLDRTPPLKELIVYKCPGISREISATVLERSSLRKTALEHYQHIFQRNVRYLPDPKTSVPVLTQFLLDHITLEMIQGLFTQDLTTFLYGIVDRINRSTSKIAIKTSTIKLLARAPEVEVFLNIYHSFLTHHFKKYEELDLEIIELERFKKAARREYGFQSLIQLFSKCSKAFDPVFADLFPRTEREEIQDYVRLFKEHLEKSLKEQNNLTRYLFTDFYFLPSRTQEVLDLLFNKEPPIPRGFFMIEMETFLGAVEAAAKEKNWSEKQKVAAFLRLLFSDWSWVERYFHPEAVEAVVPEPATTPAAHQEEIEGEGDDGAEGLVDFTDRKEGKREVI